MAKYTQAQIDALGAKGHAFRNPDGHYSYPIDDAEDLDNAIRAVGRGGASHDAIRAYIVRRAKEMGESARIPDNWTASGSNDGDGGSSRAESFGSFYRSFPLEDISIRAGGDGRTVTAYAAVFNQPAPVRDQDGEYEEILDPACFNRAIADSAPQGKRTSWRVGVFYNHGLTMMGTPSDRHSMPVGIPLDIKTDQRGMLTVTRFNKTPLADEILENIRDGSIPGYSFQGNFRRSQPMIPRYGFRRGPDGSLKTVRRMESTLKEYGPTPFPVYDDAAVMGVRAALAADPDLAMRMLSMLRDGAPQDSLPLPGAPDQGLATEDSPARRSGRTVKQEMQAARAAFLVRHGR